MVQSETEKYAASPRGEIKITLTNDQQKKRLTGTLSDTERERKRRDAARRQRLSRARRAVAKIEAKTARTRLKEFDADLYNDLIEHAVWMAEFNGLTSEQAKEQEAELILEEIEAIDAWEASLFCSPKPELINSTE